VEGEKRVFVVDEEFAGERVDKYLAEQMEDISRSQIQKLIKEGLVSVNGKECKPSHHLHCGDVVEISIPPPVELEVLPQDIPVEIIFEDEHIVVLNKAAGIVVHPGAGNPTGTLVNALLYHVDHLSSIGAPLRPGIVHRLDKETSGIMVVAKTEIAHLRLVEAIARRRVKRRYWVFVWGEFAGEKEGKIEAPIGRHPRERKRMAVVPDGKEAITYWRVIEEYKDATLLEVSLGTGRMHQIRVHMKHIGHPVIGDAVYGRRRTSKYYPHINDLINRQALHARVLSFAHPVTGEHLYFHADIPDDMKALRRYLQTGELP